MATKVRVLPKLSTKGLYLFSLVAGLVHGLVSSWLFSHATVSVFWTYGYLRPLLLVLALYWVPALLVSRWISQTHQQFWRVLLSGLCYSAAANAGWFVVYYWDYPQIVQFFWLRPSGTMTVPLAFAMLLDAGIGGVLLLSAFCLAYPVERLLGRRTIIQPGVLCWICGYDLGSTTLTTCPECGRPFDANQPHLPPSVYLLGLCKRHALPSLMAACCLVAVPLAYRFSSQTFPLLRFLAACPEGGEVRQVMIAHFVRSGLPVRPRPPLSLGWWLPDYPGKPEGFAVQFIPASDSHPVTIFVTRAYVQSGGVEWIQEGSARIYSELSREDSLQVIQHHQVPDSLLEAMRLKAVKSDWHAAGASGGPPTSEEAVASFQYFHPIAPTGPRQPPGK